MKNRFAGVMIYNPQGVVVANGFIAEAFVLRRRQSVVEVACTGML
ncbi:MAG: Uncharacterised protein [SAR116 cluster bacterium]|jgi:ABC-type sulfate transport system permease component|nr:MAG: Uncharacterised protein [SAR116 cluster bacterium]